MLIIHYNLYNTIIALMFRVFRIWVSFWVNVLVAEKTLHRSNGSENLAEAVAKLCGELDHITKETLLECESHGPAAMIVINIVI